MYLFYFYFLQIHVFLGWVRFKLSHMVTNVSSSSGSESLDSSNSDWTTAYYSSRVDKIRAILDHGQPLTIGMHFSLIFYRCDFVLMIRFAQLFVWFITIIGSLALLLLSNLNSEQCEYANGNQKDDSGPGTLLLLFSTPNSKQQHTSTFIHRAGTTSYRIETAFEVRVRTQAVCTADTSISMNVNEPIASNGQPISVWTTKEAGACVLGALLLKLTPEIGASSKHTK